MFDPTTLNPLLSKTLLGLAAPRTDWKTDFSPLPVTQAFPDPNINARDTPIWSWDSPAFAGDGVRVTNVTCKVSSMDFMKMQVLDLIEWGPVTARFESVP
jgi:hypothetical protein